MKKTTLTIVFLIVVIFAFSSLVACAQDENLNGNSTTTTTTTTANKPSDNTGNNPSDSGDTPSDSGDKTGGSDIDNIPPQDSSKKDFEGLVFSNATYDYDGTEKTISVTGNVPTNATITYSDGSNVYFLDVWQVKDTLPTSASTAELCSMSLSTYKVTVLTEE